MTLPAQVQAQSDEAKKLQELKASLTPGTASNDANPGEVQKVPDKADGTNTQAQTDAPPTGGVPDADFDQLLQKYRTLQGMFEKEKADRASTEERLKNVESLFQKMKTETETTAKAAPPVADYITEADKEKWDNETLDIMARSAQQAFAGEKNAMLSKIGELESQIASLKGVAPTVQQMAERQNVTEEQHYYNELNRLVPDWEVVDKDSRFQQWLMQQEGLSGRERQLFLEDAHKNRDALGVARYFNAFKQEVFGNESQTVGATPDKTSQLEQQITPATNRQNNPIQAPAGGDKPQFTNAEIQEFYEQKTRGEWNGREEECKKLESAIFSAVKDGRVTR